MTKRQLKALEALPDVIDALVSLAEDSEKFRVAMAKASGLGVLPIVSTPAAGGRSPPVPRGPVVWGGDTPRPLLIQTPERAEYEAQKNNPEPYNPEAEKEPAYKKRQREMMATLRNDPRRQEKLAQFAHDGAEEAAQ